MDIIVVDTYCLYAISNVSSPHFNELFTEV